MKQATSIGMPTRCEISTIGRMSAATVRAAQLGRIFMPVSDDLARQALDGRHDVRPGPRQADVGGVDPERLHQVEDGELLLDRRASDRGRLEPVAQGLVVELDRSARGHGRSARPVPVVDELGLFGMHGREPPKGV